MRRATVVCSTTSRREAPDKVPARASSRKKRRSVHSGRVFMAALFDINAAHCALVHIAPATFSGQWLRNNSLTTSPPSNPVSNRLRPHQPGASACALMHKRWARCCLFNQSQPRHTLHMRNVPERITLNKIRRHSMRVSKPKLNRPTRSAMSIAVLLALYGGTLGAAHAQEDTGTAPAVAAADDSPNKVVVTARRRAELIQDVPGAATAFSGAELEKQAIPDLPA